MNKILYWTTNVKDPDFGNEIDATNYTATLGFCPGSRPSDKDIAKLRGTSLSKGIMGNTYLMVVGPMSDVEVISGTNSGRGFLNKVWMQKREGNPYIFLPDTKEQLKEIMQIAQENNKDCIALVHNSHIRAFEKLLQELDTTTKVQGEYTKTPKSIF